MDAVKSVKPSNTKRLTGSPLASPFLLSAPSDLVEEGQARPGAPSSQEPLITKYGHEPLGASLLLVAMPGALVARSP